MTERTSMKTEAELKEEKRLRRRARRAKRGVGKHRLRPRAPGFTKALKRQIRARDDNQCVICHTGDALRIHHIDEDHDNHHPTNLITLCVGCHLQLHKGNLTIPEAELIRIQTPRGDTTSGGTTS